MSELEKTTQEIEEDKDVLENIEKQFYFSLDEEEFKKKVKEEKHIFTQILKRKDLEKKTSDFTFPFPYMFGIIEDEVYLIDSISYIFLNIFLFFRFWMPYKVYRVNSIFIYNYFVNVVEDLKNDQKNKENQEKKNGKVLGGSFIIVALIKPFLIPILSKIPGKPFVGIWFYIWFTLGAFVIWLIYKKIKARKMAKILGFTKDNYVVVRRASKINGKVCDQSFWRFLGNKIFQIIFGVAFAWGCLYMGDKENILFLTLFGTWLFFWGAYKLLHDSLGVSNKILFVKEIKRKK